MSRLILIAVLFSSFVFTGVLNARPAKQHRRIEQGVKSGQLTKEEAQQLKEGQKNIKVMKESAKADGVVTPAEKQQIKEAKKTASENIYKEKHDDEKVVK